MTTHKRDLVKRIAREQGLSELKTGQVIQQFLEQIGETLIREQRLELRGFGVFHIATKPGRLVHHPVTHEPHQLPAIRAVEFRAGKQLKARLNSQPGPSPSSKPKRKTKK